MPTLRGISVNMPNYLTIDLGTTLLKFAVFNERGEMLALTRRRPPIEHPRDGWWEIQVENFRNAIIEGCQELRRKISFDDIAAVSYASQANSFTLLDKGNQPLCPLILWPDERAIEYQQPMQQFAQATGFRAQTGLPVMSHQFALAKLLRWRHENPNLWNQSPRFVLLNDFLAFLFTGRHVAESSVAGLSGALDIHALRWRTEPLRALGLETLMLSPVVRSGTDLGNIDPSFAEPTGLPLSCRFVAGCLDQYAGAIGTGSIHPGTLTETTGTVLAAVQCVNALTPNAPADVFAGPSFDPRLFFEMSFSSTSANLLEHYRNSLPDHPSFEFLSAAAENSPAGSLKIERFQDGEHISACFRNVQPSHSRGEIVRAIMICVAEQLRDQVRALCGKILPPQIASAGGGAKSPLWQHIKSDIIGIPCIPSRCEEPTSLGAAMLAASAVTGQPVGKLVADWIPASP